jgi:hypothetical protein
MLVRRKMLQSRYGGLQSGGTTLQTTSGGANCLKNPVVSELFYIYIDVVLYVAFFRLQKASKVVVCRYRYHVCGTKTAEWPTVKIL